MTIGQGLGVPAARSAYGMHQAGRAGAAPQIASRLTGNDLDALTASDRELIAAATGQEVPPGTDARETPVPLFAIQIAMDRRSGRLSHGQDVSALYLTTRATEYDAARTGINPFSGPELDAALEYLAGRSQRGVDINL